MKHSDEFGEVKIEFVDRYMSIIVAINCEDFDGFPDAQVKSIKSKDSLKVLSSILEKIQVLDSSCLIDVRAKILYYLNNKVLDTICLDGTNNILFNGKCVKNHTDIYEKLKVYIWNN